METTRRQFEGTLVIHCAHDTQAQANWEALSSWAEKTLSSNADSLMIPLGWKKSQNCCRLSPRLPFESLDTGVLR